jgi:dipeptidyl aminopeptidase/acylaminoacyl peptidase
MYSLHSVEQGVGAVDTLNVRAGKSHRFVAFKDKFPDEIHWSPDGHTLFVNYRQTGANWSRGQIGFLRDTGAEIEPITRDTNRYTTLTLSADGRTLATILARSYTTIYVLSKVGRGFAQPRTLLSQSDQFDEWGWLNWSADGNLLVSNTGRLFKLGADGKNQTELLSDSGALIVKPSPCGTDNLVLTWTLHGGTNVPGIWRTNADGSSPLKLTDGKYDFYPVCTPDQKWVYYLDFSDSHIYRVPVNGSGQREPILPQVAAIGGLSISPDGKTLAAAVSGGTAVEPEEAARIALFELGSSSPPRLVAARYYADDMYGNGTLRFSPDGKSVAYVSRENGVDNLWVQPLDGSAGYPITDFKSEQIWSFSLSPDGKNLAILRGHFDSDVVLLQESKR